MQDREKTDEVSSGRMLKALKEEMCRRLPGLSQQGPRVNIRDGDSMIQVIAEVPGMDEKDIQVEADEGSLKISGESREGLIDNGGEWLLKEIRAGSFSRTVSIPYPVEIESAQAKCVKGLLIIELPKKPEKKRKRIKVE